MEPKFLNACRHYYERHLQQEFGSPAGAPHYRILMVEHQLRRQFSSAHRELLRWMGGKETGFIRGSDITVARLAELQDVAADLRDLWGFSFRPERDIAFYAHQGYQVAWYDGTAGENPSCFYFNEATANPENPAVKQFGGIDVFLISLFAPSRR